MPSEEFALVASDEEMVAKLIGRRPMGTYTVVVRRDDGSPVVMENAPLFDDGRPMPTRFWLADSLLNRVVGRLESSGAIDIVEAEIGIEAIATIHEAYEAERDATLPDGHEGPRPSGGVGGTRIGVKCLHAHYAYLLAGGDDAVGRWVEDKLRADGDHFDPATPGVATQLARAAGEDSEISR